MNAGAEGLGHQGPWRCRQRRRSSRRRGTIYLAILSIALIVAAIGGSALVLARGQLRLSTMNESAVRADILGQSTLDLAGFYFARIAWRSVLNNDTWTSLFNVGGATVTVKVVDELDGSLLNDANQPVRLYAKAICGDAVRIYSLRLQPRIAPNLLANADMEQAATNWSTQYCSISSRTDTPHGGTTYLYVYNRTYYYGAAIQTLGTALRNGATYAFDGWVRMDWGTASVRPVFKVTSSGDGTTYFSGNDVTVGTSWTRVQTTITPTWNGTLSSASFYVDTASGTTPFSIDDLKLIDTDEPTLVPVTGTLRREILP